jgi:hypothetical protein
MSKSSSLAEESYLTETSIERFIDFTRFIADNNLWDEVKQHLKTEGIVKITVSSQPIQSIRRLITETLLNSDRLDRKAHGQAAVIARCGCGDGGGPDSGPDGG